MKKFVCLIISIINFGIMALYLYLLPDNPVGVHFNVLGEADRYGSKWEYLIAGGILVLYGIVYAIYEAIRKYMDMKDKNEKYSKKIIYGIFAILLVIFWFIIGIGVNSDVMNQNTVMSILTVVMGALVMFISNFMPKLKQNYTMGIKVGATLKNEQVWKKTHRFAGMTGFASGAVMVVCGIISFLLNSFGVFMLFLAIMLVIIMLCLVPYIYANVLYSRLKKQGKIKPKD